jgi:hypothetical protein
MENGSGGFMGGRLSASFLFELLSHSDIRYRIQRREVRHLGREPAVRGLFSYGGLLF